MTTTMATNHAKIYIGTSGWHYKSWVGPFYPNDLKPSDYTAHYINFFQTVEINNSFYKLTSRETFENWRDSVPENFIFAVKANRFITHMKKLKDPKTTFTNFITQAEGLKEKLGPILFQLPPRWKFNEERFKAYLEILPPHYRYTFEFRDQSWYNDAAYNLLRAHNIAFCIYELEHHLSPLMITADFVYIRLHGPEGKYQGSYNEKTLVYWAENCKNWQRKGKDVFLYFDNDQNGYAALNARRLLEIIGL